MNMEKYIKKILSEKPDFSYEKVSFFADWWNHDVLLFDNERIFRFSKSGKWVKSEHDLLSYLQNTSSFRIPKSLYLSKDHSWNEESIITWQKIKELWEVDTKELLVEIAKFLKELHSIPIKDLAVIWYHRDDDNSWYLRHMKSQTMQYLAEYIDQKLIDDIFSFIDSAFGYVHPDPCLIHGDMNGKNIYRDQSLERSERLWVIDFDDALIFDPAKDFCHFWSKYWSKNLELMLEAYGHVDTWFRDRIEMHYKRSRLHVCINHIEKKRKRTPKEVAKELGVLFRR